jgi:hypothetical protein
MRPKMVPTPVLPNRDAKLQDKYPDKLLYADAADGNVSLIRLNLTRQNL